MLLRIGHGATRVCTVLPKNSARLVLAMGKGKGKSSSASSAGKSSSSGVKQPSYEFNTDGSRVLDRGVWKEFKTCASCQRIFVNRKAFEKNWSEGRYLGPDHHAPTRSLAQPPTRSLAHSLTRSFAHSLDSEVLFLLMPGLEQAATDDPTDATDPIRRRMTTRQPTNLKK